MCFMIQQQPQQPQRDHRPPPPGPYVVEGPRLTDGPGPGLRLGDYQNATRPDVGAATLDYYYRRYPALSRRPLTRSQRKTSNSRILRAALIAEGGVPEPGEENQAHHIVEGHNEAGQAILAGAGIEPNAPVNGVFLPAEMTDASLDLTLHRGSHEGGYTACVNAALERALHDPQYAGRPRDAVTDALVQIRRLLLTEAVPINQRVDATVDENTLQAVTIRTLFRNAGLID